MNIKTKAGSLSPDKRYDLTLKHGDSELVLKKASVRSFEHTGIGLDVERLGITAKVEAELRKSVPRLAVEERYEATGIHPNRIPDSTRPYEEWTPYQEELTVGFDPGDVVKAEEV